MKKLFPLSSLAGVALVVSAATAQAQVQMPGWFGSVAGWWYPWNNNGDKLSFYDNTPGVLGAAVRPDDGFGGRGYIGYRFSNPFDIAVGVQGTWLSSGKGSGADTSDVAGPISIKQRASYWLVDGELGYNGASGTFGYRLFVGARYAQFTHKMSGIEDAGITPFPVRDRDEFRGIGPRLGASGAMRFAPGSNFSVFGDVSGAYLLGRHHAKTFGDDNLVGAGNGKSGANAWNVEGQLGIAYDVAPNVSIAVGYRGEYWSSLFFKNLDGEDMFEMFGNGNRLMHGPFVRLSYNIGAPTSAPIANVAPPPAAVLAKTYIVFFDWDRSTLTPDALKTIADAAAASKTGGVQRVNVTGHADRSGSDQYNMALSLRRAGAVKDQLIRNGVPANSIVVVGRGESQPLVPTADGVREPQNRRVEIVLN